MTDAPDQSSGGAQRPAADVAGLADRLLGVPDVGAAQEVVPEMPELKETPPPATGVRTARLRQRQRHHSEEEGTPPRNRSGVRVTTSTGGRYRQSGTARQRRLKERRRARLRRQSLALTATIVVLGLAGAVALALFVGGQLRDEPVASMSPGPRPVQPAVLVGIAADPGLDAIAIFGLAADGSSSVCILVPPGTRVEVLGAGLASLSEAAAIGGAPLVATSTANLLGIRFDGASVFTREAMANVFRRVAPVPIVVPSRVTQQLPDGRVEVRFAAGPQALTPEQLVGYMTFRDADTDVDRVARQRVAWAAWLAAAGEGAGADMVSAGGDAGLQRVFAGAGKVGPDDRDFEILPVETGGVAGSDLYRPKRAEIEALIERVLPGAVPPAAVDGRIRVRILNGNGGIGVSEKVGSKLIPAGYEIVVTSNADRFSYEQTIVEFYQREFESAARDVRGILDAGQLTLNQAGSGVADVTVIVGRDLL